MIQNGDFCSSIASGGGGSRVRRSEEVKCEFERPKEG